LTIYLLRHARAGDRSAWRGDDRLRPLSARGHLQAIGLLDLLADAPLDRLLSSPYVRCMETVVPLSAARSLAIEPVDALGEGSGLEEALALVRKHATHNAVFCTHGDVIPMLLEHYAGRGIDLGPAPQCPKGSTWAVDVDVSGEAITARYLGTPD